MKHITYKIEETRQQLAALEKELMIYWMGKTGVRDSRLISILQDNYVSIKNLTFDQLHTALVTIIPTVSQMPSGSSRKIKSILSSYKITIKNGFHERLLQIDTVVDEVTISLGIDFNNLPHEFKDKYFRAEKRGLYDCEKHYSPRNFRKIRIDSYRFIKVEADAVINWYGGDKTLVNADMANEIINTIKTINHETA